MSNFAPFKNYSELWTWYFTNCDLCKFSACSIKRQIFQANLANTLSIDEAKIVGISDNNSLKSKCNNFTDSKPVKKKPVINEDQKLF